MIKIYTDGGCHGNPGPGAWAYVLQGNAERSESGFERETTNNRMELTAVIRSLQAVESGGTADPLSVCTDSQYVQKGITAWMPGWKRKGWKTASGEPVKNRDLWEKLDTLNQRLKPKWLWVRGHAGHPQNELCDQLVQQEIAKNLKKN